MKKIFTLFAILICYHTYAQNPISWHFQSQPLGNNEYLLTFDADIKEGWYLYSQEIEGKTPVPTSFQFDNLEDFTLIGNKINEVGKLIQDFDETFEKVIKKYAKEVSFQAKVKTQGAVTITGKTEFMVCDESRCLPPDTKSFSFNLAPAAGVKLVANHATPHKFEIHESKEYASEDHIIPGDTKINIPNPEPIILTAPSEKGKIKRDITNNRLPDLPKKDLYNEEKTVDLDDSGDLVASNILDYAAEEVTYVTESFPATIMKSVASIFGGGDEADEVEANNDEIPENAIILGEGEELEDLIDDENEEENKTEKKENTVVKQTKKSTKNTDPASWSYRMEALKNGIYELIFTAQLDKGWYLYSQENEGTAPFPTTFFFELPEGVEFVEENVREEGTVIEGTDPVFKKQAKKYAGEVTFKRKVKFSENVALTGSIKFMTGNNENYLMPQDANFTFNQDHTVTVATRKHLAGLWWWTSALGMLAFIALSQAVKYSTLFARHIMTEK